MDIFEAGVPQPLAIVSPRVLSLLLAAALSAAIAGPLLFALARRLLQRRGREFEGRHPIAGRTVPPAAAVEPAPVEVDSPDASEDDAPSPERRRFLSRVGVALAGLTAALVATPALGFLLAPLRRDDPEVWRPVGEVEDFPVGATVQVQFVDPAPVEWAGFASQTAAWLRRVGEEEFVAFSAYCTHVGCPVRWFPEAGLFLCPCHGGAFHEDGRVAAGPPPEPLGRYAVRVRLGQVEIQPAPIPRAEG